MLMTLVCNLMVLSDPLFKYWNYVGIFPILWYLACVDRIFVRIDSMILAVSLSILTGTLSGPVALL
jgi:hypothetical protein